MGFTSLFDSKQIVSSNSTSINFNPTIVGNSSGISANPDNTSTLSPSNTISPTNDQSATAQLRLRASQTDNGSDNSSDTMSNSNSKGGGLFGTDSGGLIPISNTTGGGLNMSTIIALGAFLLVLTAIKGKK